MNIGERVENFELLDQNGEPRSLESLTALGPVVIFFYPLAGSSGCTKEACHFRDLGQEFADAGASIIGISRDTPAKQLAFAKANGFSFPLLSDVDGEVSDQFEVRRRFLAKALPVKRATFVIDKDGVLRHQITSETNMDVHANDALKALAALV